MAVVDSLTMRTATPNTSDPVFEEVHAADIRFAQGRISSVISPTSLQYCPRLSEQYGVEVYLKREDLQLSLIHI